MALALERVQRDNIPGALAELGVWRGATSAFIRSQVTQRPFYLFDTFSGFPGKNQPDYRFRNTSVDLVRRRIGDCSDVHFRVGNFPDTTLGLESEVFAFVLIDVDKFESTLAGLRFFYERVPRGGYIFLHDYNSPESERGVSRAVSEFLDRKLEQIVELPDVWGSAVFRKVS
jgi:O-methyltransferase